MGIGDRTGDDKENSVSMTRQDVDAYGQELARIGQHQSEATAARFTMFQALAAVGLTDEQADELVSKLEAGAVAGAHTWISESSPPHGSEPRFEDGWFEGVRDVASYLLRIADNTATAQRGRAASNAMLLARLQQSASPAPELPDQEPDPAAALDAMKVLAAQRCTWALAEPGPVVQRREGLRVHHPAERRRPLRPLQGDPGPRVQDPQGGPGRNLRRHAWPEGHASRRSPDRLAAPPPTGEPYLRPRRRKDCPATHSGIGAAHPATCQA